MKKHHQRSRLHREQQIAHGYWCTSPGHRQRCGRHNTKIFVFEWTPECARSSPGNITSKISVLVKSTFCSLWNKLFMLTSIIASSPAFNTKITNITSLPGIRGFAFIWPTAPCFGESALKMIWKGNCNLYSTFQESPKVLHIQGKGIHAQGW